MANKSLTDLTARTATADSDLLHINSGGTDYKETKINFLQGDFNHVFANNAILTTQVNSLSIGTYIGKIASYTHQSETGVPANDNFYVYAHVYSSADAYVSIRRTYGDEEYIAVKSGGTWGSWTKTPNRSEITSLNNSLTKSSSSYTVNSNVSVIRLVCYKVAGIFVCSGVVTLSSGFTTGASLLKLSDIRPVETIDFTPYVAGGSPPWYLDTYGWMHCNGSTPTGTYFFNFCGSLA